jgi:hypothetical protein
MAKIVCVLYDDPVDGYPSSNGTTSQRSSHAGSQHVRESDVVGTELSASGARIYSGTRP